VRAVACCSALILAVIVAWLLVPRLRTGSAATSAARVSDAPPAETPGASLSLAEGHVADVSREGFAENSPAAKPSPGASERTLTVRSSIGLPLPFAEWQASDGDWRQIDLDQGHCDPRRLALPCNVRAPGHTASLAPKAGQEIVLEPDALLVLEAHDLHALTRTIRVQNRYASQSDPLWPALRRACAFGFLSADSWAVAVSHDLIDDPSRGNDFVVDIEWPDHRHAAAHFMVAAGLHATWTVPCEVKLAGAPLHIEVERPENERAGEVILQLGWVNGEQQEGRSENFDWGRVYFWPPQEVSVENPHLPSGTTEFTFDFIPTGVQFNLTARDEASAAYGGLVFVHDGSSRKLTLLPGFTLAGHLVADDDSSPMKEATLLWEFRDEPETKYMWRSENFPLRLGDAGSFEASGPKFPTLSTSWFLNRPSKLFVSVQVRGFEPLERQFDTAGARRLDCGDLRLVRSRPTLTLAAGHCIPPGPAETALRTSSRPDIQWIADEVSRESDGAIDVYLSHAEKVVSGEWLFAATNLRTRQQLAVAWPEEPPRWITIYVQLSDYGEDRLFELQGDGRYAAAPRVERSLLFECGVRPASGKSWSLGWTWHEQWGGLWIELPQHAGEIKQLRITTPEDGASLWWSDTEFPPGFFGRPGDAGGTTPLDASTARCVLQ